MADFFSDDPSMWQVDAETQVFTLPKYEQLFNNSHLN